MHILKMVLFLLFWTCLPVAASPVDKTQDQKFKITVTGNPADPKARALYKQATALQLPVVWENSSAESHSSTIPYPILNKPAAYICIKDTGCSLPIYDSAALQKTAHLMKYHTLRNSGEQYSKSVSVLSGHHLVLIIVFFWFLGLLLSFTPCVFPLLIMMAGFIVGNNRDGKRIRLAAVCVLAIAVSYALAGLGSAISGFYIQAWMQNKWILLIFSLFFIFLALSMLDIYTLQLPAFLRHKVIHFNSTRSAGSYLGVTAMGLVTTLIAAPCAAAPLIGILSYVADQGSPILGGIALFFTGLGMGTPLFLVSLLQKKFTPLIAFPHDAIKKLFGLLLMAMAIILIKRIAPDNIVMLLWAGLALLTAIYAGLLRKKSVHPYTIFFGMLKWLGLLYCTLLLLSAASGNYNPLRPLPFQRQPDAVPFISVPSLSKMKKIFNMARLQNKPILVDIYASWCATCVEMEKKIFSTPEVRMLLTDFIAVQLDLSEITPDKEDLAKKLQVIAPPAVLFFTPDGKKSATVIIGEITKDEFLSALKTVLRQKDKPG